MTQMRIHLFDACITSPDYGLSYYLVCLLVTMHYCCRGVVSNTPVCFVRSFLAVYKSIKSALKKTTTYILLKSSHTGLNW